MSVNTSNYQALCESVIKNTEENGVKYSRTDLVNLFENLEYYNGGEKGKAAIQEQIDKLEKTLKTLRKEAEDLQEKINSKNIKAEKKSDDLAKIAGQINLETAEYQNHIKEAAKQATRDAMTSYRYSNENSYEVCFESAFKQRIGDIAGLDMAKIKDLYQQYDNLKNQIRPIASEIQGYLTEVKTIQGKLDNTNATINLLSMTKNNMTDTINGAYSNIDTNANAPVFSGKKAALANQLIADYSIAPAAGAEGAAPAEGTEGAAPAGDAQAADNAGAAAPKTAAEKMADYAAQNKEKYPGGSYYATYRQNPEVRNLCEAVKNGMLEDLQASGASVDDIMKFVSENWNVGILRNVDANGQVTYTIPNKSDSGKEMYDKLNAFAATGKATTATGTTPTQAKIPTNQLDNIKKNGSTVLDKLYEGGFTFKEAMYVFTQIFGEAGVTYNLASQTSGRNYGILIDDETSDKTYKTLAEKIKNYWNVDSSNQSATTGLKTVRGNNDPILFQDGDTTYTFIIDKDGDGKFDYTDGKDNELLGSENGIKDLLHFDYNNDGVIDENDINEETGECALDELTLMSNKQIESVKNSTDVNNYKDGSTGYANSVDFDVSYTSARDLGITKIHLEALKDIKNDDTKTGFEDNVNENYNDVNGSNVINEFEIEFGDSKKITAQETLNTDANLELFYGQVSEKAGKIKSGLTEEQFNSAFDKWYNTDASETARILDELSTELEAMLREDPEEPEDPSIYDLNYTWEEFQELYGDGQLTGEYINMVIQRSVNSSKSHAEREKKVGSQYSPEDPNSNYSQGEKAVEKAVEELNESLKIKRKNEAKEEK